MVASSVYSRAFSIHEKAPVIWFSFKLDTLYLDWGCPPYEEQNDYHIMDMGDDVQRILNLAVHKDYHHQVSEHDDDTSVNFALHIFSNLKALNIVTVQHDYEDCSDLVFLELSEAVDRQDYSEFGEQEFHPVFRDFFPTLEAEHNSDTLWSDTLYDDQNYYIENENNGRTIWPTLEHKAVVTRQCMDEFLEHKQEYDDERDSGRIAIFLKANGYDSLHTSVSLITTMTELAAMFCKERNITLTEDNLKNHVSVFNSLRPQDFAIDLQYNLVAAGLNKTQKAELEILFHGHS